MAPTSGGAIAVVNKKEELWKRRWARAKGLMEEHGVVLKSWRVGTDVMDDAVRLIDGWQKDH